MGKKVVVAVRFELTTFAGALARKGSGQVSLPLHQPATCGHFYLITVRRTVPESAHIIRLVDLTHRSFLAYSVSE
jgi:hypothetical protein